MDPFPALKYFKVVRNTTFDYRFRYFVESTTSSTAVDLTNYAAQWIITWANGTSTYSRVSASLLPSQTGVAFGGDTADPTNGTIDMVISAADTLTLPWTIAQYSLILINTVTTDQPELLRGGIAIVPATDPLI